MKRLASAVNLALLLIASAGLLGCQRLHPPNPVDCFGGDRPGPDRPVYVPGCGQALTRHDERALTRLRPMLSQFMTYADPERVNTFYAVLHVDHFYSREQNPYYIVYDEATGEVTYSEEFEQHLGYWDELLTDLIDPLVAEGYLEWTSLPETGALYLEWEDACAQR